MNWAQIFAMLGIGVDSVGVSRASLRRCVEVQILKGLGRVGDEGYAAGSTVGHESSDGMNPRSSGR